MGINKTSNYSLNKPTKGTRNWDTYMNANADIIDQELKRQKDVDISINARIDNIVSDSGDSNQEIIDARYSTTKGKTYTVLKDRLEDIESSISLAEVGFGIEWDYQTDTCRRIGRATGKDRSFFDNQMPWAGMRRCKILDYL